jgi:hypothetical protein
MKQKIILKYETRNDRYTVTKLVNRLEPKMGSVLNEHDVKTLLVQSKASTNDITVEIQ